jgi:hypothetical protein
MVEVTDHESSRDLDIFFRGGDNEMNFNELTRSIDTTITVTDFDDSSPTTTGLVTATTTFTDGNGVVIGGTNTAVSYSQQNAIAAGSLRVEASQDAEDSVTFAGATDKLFILGEVVDGSDQITVTLGEGGSENTVELTGYEILQDAATDDVYDMRDLDRVLNNLTLQDDDYPGAPSTDHDTIVVDNDANAFDGGPAEHEAPANTISLEVLNDTFGFDFDVLDMTNVTDSGLTVTGDDDDQNGDATLNNADATYVGVDGDVGATGALRDLTDTVIFGSLGLVDTVTLFDVLALTDASVASSGSSFDLDFTDSQLQNGSDTSLFTIDADADTLDASRVTSDLTLTARGGPATLIGGSGDDSITGGVGADTLRGGAGSDTLDGGTGSEIRQIQLSGVLDDDASTSPVTVTFGPGAYALSVTEGTEIVEGAGSVAVGDALATAINADLVAINAGAAWTNGDTLTGASFDGTLLSFTFAAGDDVDNTDTIAVTSGDASFGVTFLASAETVVSEGGDGGADTFIFDAFSAVDTVNDFVSGTDLIQLDISFGTGPDDIQQAHIGSTSVDQHFLGTGGGTQDFDEGDAPAGLFGSGLFTGTNLADLQANLLAVATGSFAGSITSSNVRAAFGRTTGDNKLFVFTLTDAAGTNNTQISQTRTIATIGSTFVAGDITLI